MPLSCLKLCSPQLDEEIGEEDLAQASKLDTSSTWTYLINDQPMGDTVYRFMRGVRGASSSRLYGPTCLGGE